MLVVLRCLNAMLTRWFMSHENVPFDIFTVLLSPWPLPCPLKSVTCLIWRTREQAADTLTVKAVRMGARTVQSLYVFVGHVPLYEHLLSDSTNFYWSVYLQLQRLCNVVYRKFNFSKFPAHVKDLHTYAFKPIIVHVCIKISIFWLGARRDYSLHRHLPIKPPPPPKNNNIKSV